MELCRPQTGAMDGVDDPFWMLVAEDADGQDLRREAAGDVVHLLSRDLPRRRSEHEADGVGAHGDGEQRVVLVGDPADLHEHALLTVPARPTGEWVCWWRLTGIRRRRAGSGSSQPDRPTSPGSHRRG